MVSYKKLFASNILLKVQQGNNIIYSHKDEHLYQATSTTCPEDIRTFKCTSPALLSLLPWLHRTFFCEVQPEVVVESLCIAYPTLSVAYAKTGIPKDEFWSSVFRIKTVPKAAQLKDSSWARPDHLKCFSTVSIHKRLWALVSFNSRLNWATSHTW